MGLYLRLALATGVPFGLLMAVGSGAFDSAGEFMLTAALYGVPFGVLFALIVGTLHRRGVAKVEARAAATESTRSRGGEG